MTAGFQTQSGSLYWIDPRGRTHRLKKSKGERCGELHEPHACIFISSKIHDEAHSIGFTSLYRFYMARLEKGLLVDCSDPEQIKAAFTNGERAGLAIMDRASRVIIGGGPGVQTPVIGHHPFEQSYVPDPEKPGHNMRLYHIGSPVTRLYNTNADLVAAGFPVGHILRHTQLPRPAPLNP